MPRRPLAASPLLLALWCCLLLPWAALSVKVKATAKAAARAKAKAKAKQVPWAYWQPLPPPPPPQVFLQPAPVYVMEAPPPAVGAQPVSAPVEAPFAQRVLPAQIATPPVVVSQPMLAEVEAPPTPQVLRPVGMQAAIGAQPVLLSMPTQPPLGAVSPLAGAPPMVMASTQWQMLQSDVPSVPVGLRPDAVPPEVMQELTSLRQQVQGSLSAARNMVQLIADTTAKDIAVVDATSDRLASLRGRAGGGWPVVHTECSALQASCGDCVGQPSCIWCVEEMRCSPGDAQGPARGSCGFFRHGTCGIDTQFGKNWTR